MFKSAVQRLLLSSQELDCGGKERQQQENKGAPPSDYDLIASLEHLISASTRQKANTKCLEASLRQLEAGFRNSYKDTITLLGSN